MLRWCESYGVDYIVGIAGNTRLKQLASTLINQSEDTYNRTEEKHRLFGTFKYVAASRDRERRIIVKAEHTSLGANTLFILTSLEGDEKKLYDEIYCARGDMENRIKEQQLDLFADRTSCHNWWPNQLRLMLSSFAYVLYDHIRRIARRTLDSPKPQAPPFETNSFVSEQLSLEIPVAFAAT